MQSSTPVAGDRIAGREEEKVFLFECNNNEYLYRIERDKNLDIDLY